MQTTKLYEILSSYNRYWTTGDIDAGIKRDLLPDCLGQLDSAFRWQNFFWDWEKSR